MFKLRKNLEALYQDLILKRITSMQIHKGKNFHTSFLVKLNKESPLAIGLFQEELKTSQYNLNVQANEISFDQDLSIAESQLIDLSQYEIKPGLLVYDDSIKKILINFEQTQRQCKGIYLGEVYGKLKELKKLPNYDEKIQLSGEPFIDQLTERIIQIMFVSSFMIFLASSTYIPERCSEEYIRSEQQFEKLNVKK